MNEPILLVRIPIVDGDNQVVGIVSQSRVIQFLSQQIKKFPNLSQKKLKEWTNVTLKSPVHTVSVNDRAIDAYQVMIEKVQALQQF
jgi:hypothetical protein